VGVDASDRPVLAELRSQRGQAQVREVWRHGEGWSDVRTVHGARRVMFDDGRAVAVVGFEGGRSLVERWNWSDSVPARGDMSCATPDWRFSEVYVANTDADGRLVSLTRGHGDIVYGESDVEEALDEMLAQAATLTPTGSVLYDARVDRREPHLRPTQQLLDLLPAAFEDAVVAAVAASGVERPFVVEVRSREDGGFQPFGRVGAGDFRERMVAVSPEPEAAVTSLYRAQPPDGATFELVDHLIPDAATACRELAAALSPKSEDRERASSFLQLLAREVAERLNRRTWPGADQPFLALVHIGPHFDHIDPYTLAAAVAGRERVSDFRASLKPRWSAVHAPVGIARRDRAALEEHLAESALERHAHRLAHEVAELGLRMQPADEARSRLGGPALLPPGEPWPHDADNRPLTFLAGIDLSEMPEHGPLPEDGWLLFFADLDNDDAEGLIDESVNEPGAKARLFALPGDVDPVPATPPETLQDVLGDRPVAFEAHLTLPDGYDSAAELGLDPAEGEAYEALASGLRYAEEGWSADRPDHWVLGAVTSTQGERPEPDTVLLLHIATDQGLQFEFLDAGAIQFRIGTDALAAGEWRAARALADTA
jgi:hypothetical protein